MSEMVERLAKVLAETAPWADGQLLPIDAEQFIPAVRAVIQAMREPTEDMVEHETYRNGSWDRRALNAMIDAALAD